MSKFTKRTNSCTFEYFKGIAKSITEEELANYIESTNSLKKQEKLVITNDMMKNKKLYD